MLTSTGFGSCLVLAIGIAYLIYLAVPAKAKR